MTAAVRFPAGEVGRHLAWYFDVRVRGVTTPEEVDAHFDPEYRWGWGSPREPAALEAWFSRWRALRARIEDVEELEPGRYVVTTRLDNGVVTRVWFEMEATPPYRIRRTATTEATPSESDLVDFGAAIAIDTDGEGKRAQVPPVFTTSIGPFGGYVAALAVGAAADHTDKSVPVSMTGHFLNSGRAGAVRVEQTTLRRSSRLESTRVELWQGDAQLFDALVWGAEPPSAQPDQPDQSVATMPHVPSPADAPVDHWVRLFGGSMDAVRVPDGGDIVGSAAWTRLAPRSTFGDAWVDAARLLLPIDWVAVGVTNRLLPEDAGFVIPSTIEVSVVFYNHDHATDWVLCHAHAPVSAGGRATANATVWSEDGHVLALAMVHVLQRGRPRNPTQ